MAYNKNYNRNGGKYNKNYNRNDRNYNGARYENRPHATRDNVLEFNALEHKKPNIKITDVNGKRYEINGKLSVGFIQNMVAWAADIQGMTMGQDNLREVADMLGILREFALQLINLNVDGVTYTMEDVDRGFNDVEILYSLFVFITGIAGTNLQETTERISK